MLRAAQNGASTEQIGLQLSLSAATVRNYLSNAITKVGARNRIDAIRIAREAGWQWCHCPAPTRSATLSRMQLSDFVRSGA